MQQYYIKLVTKQKKWAIMNTNNSQMAIAIQTLLKQMLQANLLHKDITDVVIEFN